MSPCQCGCGRDTGQYVRSCRGHKKGDPRKFVTGHKLVPGIRERYQEIQGLWFAGVAARGIAEVVELSESQLNNSVRKMRDQGWDMPYRYQREQRPDLRSAPIGHRECPQCGDLFEVRASRKHCDDCRHFLESAHRAVRKALRVGALVRPEACEGCGRMGGTEAHHADYSKQLEVEWLCPKCHMGIHARQRLGRMLVAA